MKKLLVVMITTILSVLSLISCSHGSTYYLKKLENEIGIKYLSNTTTLFFYKNISGLDSSGIFYYVLKFDEKPVAFFSQFENEKPEPYKKFEAGKNVSFEEKVNTLIYTFFKNDYDNFDEKYKINWNLSYLFSNNTPDYVTFPMIYFEDSFELILIKLHM